MDGLTGLIRCRSANLAEFPLAWQEALDFVAAMNREQRFGQRDWRMPNRRELRSLLSRNSAECDCYPSPRSCSMQTPEARRGAGRQYRADGKRAPCAVETAMTRLQTMSRTMLPQGAHFQLV